MYMLVTVLKVENHNLNMSIVEYRDVVNIDG